MKKATIDFKGIEFQVEYDYNNTDGLWITNIWHKGDSMYDLIEQCYIDEMNYNLEEIITKYERS